MKETKKILDKLNLSISNLQEARAYMNGNLPEEFIKPTDDLLNTLIILKDESDKFING